MLVYAGGRERTATEFRQLLDEAGVRLVACAELTAGLQVLQAAVA
jgi:hypothetical protein